MYENDSMFKNVSGTHHSKRIAQALSNGTLVMLTGRYFQSKVTTNLVT